MTKEEIIEMAIQVGIHYRELSEEFATGNGDGVEIEQMQAFARLIAEKEREECAKIAENRILHDENKDIKKGYLFAQQSIAQDIRTRRKE